MVWSALLTAGASLLGAGMASSASKDAAKRQAEASDAATEELRRQYDIGLRLQSPYLANSYAAGDEIMSRLGLNASAGAATLQSLLGGGAYGGGAATGGGPDYAAYVDAYPDLKDAYTTIQQYARLPASKTGGVLLDKNGDGVVSKGEFGQFHWETDGRAGGSRTLPQAATLADILGGGQAGQALTDRGVDSGGRIVSTTPASRGPAGSPRERALNRERGGFVSNDRAPMSQVPGAAPPPVASTAQAPAAPTAPIASLASSSPTAPPPAVTAPSTLAPNGLDVVPTPNIPQPELGGAAPTGAIPRERTDLELSLPGESRLQGFSPRAGSSLEALLEPAMARAAQVPAPGDDPAAFLASSPRATAARRAYADQGREDLRQALYAGGVANSGRGVRDLADYAGRFENSLYDLALNDALNERAYATGLGQYIDGTRRADDEMRFRLGAYGDAYEGDQYSRMAAERSWDQGQLDQDAAWLAGERGHGVSEDARLMSYLMALYNPSAAASVANQGMQYAGALGNAFNANAFNQGVAGVQNANIWGRAIGDVAGAIGSTDWSSIFGGQKAATTSGSGFNAFGGAAPTDWSRWLGG